MTTRTFKTFHIATNEENFVSFEVPAAKTLALEIFLLGLGAKALRDEGGQMFWTLETAV